MASESTAEHVADLLRRQILVGEIPPGTPLREVALSAEFRVSRNTFREALRTLVFEGLVRHAPNRGATVARLGPADAADIYEVRRVLELAALERAAASRPAELRPLGVALDALELAAAERAWLDLVEADLKFHRSLVDALGSDRLSALFATIEAQLRLAFSIVAFADREFEQPEPLLEEHRELFDLIVRGDVEPARHALVAHLESYRDRLLAVLAGDVGETAEAHAG